MDFLNDKINEIKNNGVFFTTKNIVELLINTIDKDLLKNKNIKILENSNGIGNITLLLIDELTKYHDIKHVLENMIYTMELNNDYNEYYKNKIKEKYGDYKLNSYLGNSLDFFLNIKFDLIVGNPPYSKYKGKIDEIYKNKVKRLETLFIQHAHYHLKDNCKCYYILPQDFEHTNSLNNFIVIDFQPSPRALTSLFC